ncbi:MAG: transcription elongation factor GreB [Gammaproteobacteria bacterium]|nr:transcription elongation factor GreB [Gammaproteobacteria bacterium]
MSRAFVRENEDAPEDDPGEVDAFPIPAGAKNYVTPAGHARLRSEFDLLWKGERPELVKTIAWAAANGDRSENADYIYGKRRLREIDRRIRYLSKRLEQAEVVDPLRQENREQVFFGATVTVRSGAGVEQTLAIVGFDEAEPSRGRVSWVSPIARALLRARAGDTVALETPAGVESLEQRRVVEGDRGVAPLLMIFL